MNNEQSEKSIKCNLFIDHQLSWAGDGYFCENCRVRFEPVPNERSEELPCYCAEINSRNCPRYQNSEESADYTKPEWDGWKIISDMLDNPDENGIYPTSKAYQQLYDFVVSHKQQAIQAERTRIIKAIEGLKKEELSRFEHSYKHPLDIGTRLGYNQAISEAIRAVGESAEKGEV